MTDPLAPYYSTAGHMLPAQTAECSNTVANNVSLEIVSQIVIVILSALELDQAHFTIAHCLCLHFHCTSSSED